MTILNNLYQSNITNFIPKYFLRKLKKKFNYYFVEINKEKLPENNNPTSITFDGQEKLIENFDHKNYIPWTTCPHLVQLLKLIFIDKSKEYNFLDFGGANIDHYFYLKKNFKNLKYFYFDQKKNNEIISEIKKEYLLNDMTVLNNLSEIKKNNYDFINFGSVIQYVDDYKLILNNLIQSNPEYIFFTGQTFYEKKINKEENIIVKQVNILPQVNYCYFFEYESFLNIFKVKKFKPVFKVLNFTDRVNYNNFNKKYGKIEYCDLLIKKDVLKNLNF